MVSATVDIGRVIRMGRGWVEVEVNGQVRRIVPRADLLIRAGCYLHIIDNQGIAILPNAVSPTAGAVH